MIPDAAAENATRTTYTDWMRHGLRVAEALATVPVDAPAWPEPESADAAQSTWTEPPRHAYRLQRTSTETALDVGWLVTAATNNEPPAGDGVLSGLTVAVKDVIDVAGLPVHNGTPGALWRLPTESARAWDSLATAGARCVGKAATHEMAWGVTTPRIPHPMDPDRVTGGSSGGPAACVATRVSEGALGTDTGGSIRIPSALCGVVGFRPTTGAIDMRGITPLAPEQDAVGPLASDVRTCTAMLEVLLARPLGIGSAATRPADGLRLGVLRDPGPLDAETDGAYRRTLKALARTGVDVIAVETPLLRQSTSISLLTMLRSSAEQHAEAVRSARAGFGGEARALLTLGGELESDLAVIDRARRSLTTKTARLFTDYQLDAFLTPTTACVAPSRGSDTVEINNRAVPVASALTRFTAWASVTAMPALSIPVQTSGLPVGAQVMAPPNHEHVCVRLALHIEELSQSY